MRSRSPPQLSALTFSSCIAGTLTHDMCAAATGLIPHGALESDTTSEALRVQVAVERLDSLL